MKRPRVKVPLRLEALAVEGCDVQRSGIRWLCDDGHRCRPGEVVAWCNVGLAPRPGYTGGPLPFQEEARDFQVALAPRLGGRLVKARAVSRGGFLDLHEHHHRWSPETVIGHLECDGGAPGDDPERAGALRMLFLAGRRVAEHADVRWGPLTGWHDRSRAWWADGGGDWGTVLSLGVCEQLGVVRGERGAFFELFETVPGPAHVVFVPDEVLVPSAAVLLAQLRRTEDERRQIADDLGRSLAAAVAADGGNGPAVASAWIFAGCLLKALLRSPLLERYPLLTPADITRTGPPGAVILSLHAEHPFGLRHKRLGFPLDFHPFRLRELGPVARRWLESEFESVRRTTDDVRRDYRELLTAVRERTGAHVLVLNALAVGGLEEICCYAPFDKPLGETLPDIRTQERNLMLCDLAREHDISVVDVDALAVELGTEEHIPDGIHQSGRLQAAVRSQVVRILRERGVSGFGPRHPEPVRKGNRAVRKPPR